MNIVNDFPNKLDERSILLLSNKVSGLKNKQKIKQELEKKHNF